MIYNRISPSLIAIVAIVIIGIIYFYGSTAHSTCLSIGDCKACYNDFYTVVDNSFCGGNISDGYVCVKDKDVERRNAMVDLLECACKTYPGKYQAEKEKLHKLLLYSTTNTTAEIVACDFKNYPVVRWKESYIIVPEELVKLTSKQKE